MCGPHLCNEYIKGFDAFIDFTEKDMLDNIRGNLCCPCKHCKNEKKYHVDDVLRSHLIKMDSWRINDGGRNMGRKHLMKQRWEIDMWRGRSRPVSKKIMIM
jgi:hypothetical protein